MLIASLLYNITLEEIVTLNVLMAAILILQTSTAKYATLLARLALVRLPIVLLVILPIFTTLVVSPSALLTFTQAIKVALLVLKMFLHVTSLSLSALPQPHRIIKT
jgi:hypothetical protein